MSLAQASWVRIVQGRARADGAVTFKLAAVSHLLDPESPLVESDSLRFQLMRSGLPRRAVCGTLLLTIYARNDFDTSKHCRRCQKIYKQTLESPDEP
jgi:hypothetical protein